MHREILYMTSRRKFILSCADDFITSQKLKNCQMMRCPISLITVTTKSEFQFLTEYIPVCRAQPADSRRVFHDSHKTSKEKN